MFFDMDILCQRRNGKFAAIWIAATRGITHLKKSDIEKVNIIYICDDILKYIISNSPAPRSRLSLYLSAKLLYGTVLIYSQQIRTLESSALFFSVTLKRPVPVKRTRPFDEDEERKRRQRKIQKKKRKEAEDLQLPLDAQILQPLPQVNPNATDISQITLRDEISTRLHLPEQEPFGDEGQIQQQLEQFDKIPLPDFQVPEPEPVPVPPINGAETVAGVDKRLIETVEDVQQSPSKRRKPEQVHTLSPIVTLQQHGALSPQSADRALMPPPPEPRRSHTPRRVQRIDTTTRLTDDEMLDNILAPPEPVRRPRPRRRNLEQYLSQEFSLLHHSKWQTEQIIYQSIEIVTRRTRCPQEGSQGSLTPLLINSNDAVDIVEEILGEIRRNEVDDIISANINDSIQPLRRLSDPNAQILEQASIPEINVPSIDITHGAGAQPDVSFLPSPRVSRIESFHQPQSPILEQEAFQQPAVPEPFQQPEISVPEPITEVSTHTPRIHTSTPIRFENEVERHSILLKYLRELFNDGNNQPILLQDICIPLIRVNVAKTFHALLYLHAKQYITLTTYPNSLELKEILPGLRI